MCRLPRIAIIIYSMYSHIVKLAEAEKGGIEAAGGKATIYQVQETLPEEVLKKMHVPKDRMTNEYPIASPDTLEAYDAYLFGIPTRFGNMPTQFRAFWDQTGKQWSKGSLSGKFAGVFVSTASLGGGQEGAGFTLITTLVHLGIVFVPLGYKPAMRELSNVDEAHGGSPWGAGTIANGKATREPSELELTIARKQGEAFYNLVKRVDFEE